jgi:hypothetical protein
MTRQQGFNFSAPKAEKIDKKIINHEEHEGTRRKYAVGLKAEKHRPRRTRPQDTEM